MLLLFFNFEIANDNQRNKLSSFASKSKFIKCTLGLVKNYLTQLIQNQFHIKTTN